MTNCQEARWVWCHCIIVSQTHHIWLGSTVTEGGRSLWSCLAVDGSLRRCGGGRLGLEADWKQLFFSCLPLSCVLPWYLSLDKNLALFPKLIKTSFCLFLIRLQSKPSHPRDKKIFQIPSKAICPERIWKTHSGTHGRCSFLRSSQCACSRTHSCSGHISHTHPCAGMAGSSRDSLWKQGERHLWETWTRSKDSWRKKSDLCICHDQRTLPVLAGCTAFDLVDTTGVSPHLCSALSAVKWASVHLV